MKKSFMGSPANTNVKMLLHWLDNSTCTVYVHLYSIHVQLCFGLLVFNLQNVLELYVHVHVYINYM